MKRLIVTALSLIGLTGYAQRWTVGSGMLYTSPTSTKIGVGITPTEFFHINGGALKIGNSTNLNDRSINLLKFGDGDYVKIGEFEADDQLSFYASQGYSFNMQSGNMEFKVNNATKLQIRAANGYIYIPYNVNLTFGQEIVEGYNRIRISHSGTHGYIDYKDNLYFRADKNWISALTLYGNGSVGVGFGTGYNAGQYLNMGYKLAVNGGIVCEEVKVIADVPDADYVFEEDYNLVPLSEVEAFIKENKHLPNIPSAEDFKTNGYKLGDMDGMLLRKVEELTLYIIEQQKQTVEQQKLIEALQKRLSELENKKGGEE